MKQTLSEAAPKSCFRQHEIPPQNEFEVGKKLETVDPRNRTSMCIATVVDKIGPRLRLRLDGTDDRNDFWLLVDSEYIHPFEYTTKRGGQIQPPLGFRNNISTWPRFFDKIVQSAGETTFATDSCFKQPPQKPPKNEFKKGHKLEAVDQKNPHLICPATVKDIDKDNIFISFDGWSQLCNFWCHFASRDIFPIGWCKMADHPLQLPGSEKRKSVRRSGGATNNNNSASGSQINGSKSLTTTLVVTPTAATPPPIPSPKLNGSFTKQSKENEAEKSVQLNSSKNEESSIVVNEKASSKKQNKIPQAPMSIDLSIVKTESIDAFDKSTVSSKKEQKASEQSKPRDSENVNSEKEKG